MKEETDSDTNITKRQFENVVKQFKDRNKRGYDFLTKAGFQIAGFRY